MIRSSSAGGTGPFPSAMQKSPRAASVQTSQPYGVRSHPRVRIGSPSTVIGTSVGVPCRGAL